jgi:hypothetical protein
LEARCGDSCELRLYIQGNKGFPFRRLNIAYLINSSIFKSYNLI